METRPETCSFDYHKKLAGLLRKLSFKFDLGLDFTKPSNSINEVESDASATREQPSDGSNGGDSPEEALNATPHSGLRVKFDETADNARCGGKAYRCEDFMEQTISVAEIEMFFDIDFEKDWVNMVSSYRPSARSSEPLTKEQMLLEAKIHKAEKLMRKRDEKIQSLTEKAGTSAEAERIRREVMKQMRIKAEKYMEKRKRQWQKQSLKAKKKEEADVARRAKLDRGDQ